MWIQQRCENPYRAAPSITKMNNKVNKFTNMHDRKNKTGNK